MAVNPSQKDKRMELLTVQLCYYISYFKVYSEYWQFSFIVMFPTLFHKSFKMNNNNYKVCPGKLRH